MNRIRITLEFNVTEGLKREVLNDEAFELGTRNSNRWPFGECVYVATEALLYDHFGPTVVQDRENILSALTRREDFKPK